MAIRWLLHPRDEPVVCVPDAPMNADSPWNRMRTNHVGLAMALPIAPVSAPAAIFLIRGGDDSSPSRNGGAPSRWIKGPFEGLCVHSARTTSQRAEAE